LLKGFRIAPLSEAVIDSCPRAIFFGHFAPSCAGPKNKEYAIEQYSIIGRFAASLTSIGTWRNDLLYFLPEFVWDFSRRLHEDTLSNGGPVCVHALIYRVSVEKFDRIIEKKRATASAAS